MRVSGTQEDRKYSPPSMVCRFPGKKCLEVSKETWKEPGKDNLPTKEVREVLEQGVGARRNNDSRNNDFRSCTYLQGCRLGAQLGREDTEQQGH